MITSLEVGRGNDEYADDSHDKEGNERDLYPLFRRQVFPGHHAALLKFIEARIRRGRYACVS